MSRIDKNRPHKLCVVLKGYPRLSETFIAQEIRELERSGFNITIVSLRHPYDPTTHPIHDEITAGILYLPEYLHLQPIRVIRGLVVCLLRRNFWRCAVQFSKDFRRDRTLNRCRRFGQAWVMAAELPQTTRFYYAHFMHTPASVTHYASLLTSTPWGISAHAKDIWTIPDWEKRQKLHSVEWLVTCTRSNYEHLKGLFTDRGTTTSSANSLTSEANDAATDTTATTATDEATDEALDGTNKAATKDASRVHLVYHGIDLSRFALPPAKNTDADGRDNKHTVTLLSVGRMVTKKGYEYLLEALSRLPADLHWKFVHIGGGELTKQLQEQAKSLAIDNSVTWLGAQPQSVVLDNLQSADLFVLPSVIGEDGDRDGLPNVLMEAQSQKLACLSTNISGIPELIDHGVTGWLVNERNTDELADALKMLITDPELRKALATKGFARLHDEFSHISCLHTLHELLNDSVQNSTKAAVSG